MSKAETSAVIFGLACVKGWAQNCATARRRWLACFCQWPHG